MSVDYYLVGFTLPALTAAGFAACNALPPLGRTTAKPHIGGALRVAADPVGPSVRR